VTYFDLIFTTFLRQILTEQARKSAQQEPHFSLRMEGRMDKHGTANNIFFRNFANAWEWYKDLELLTLSVIYSITI
jgi:hypothetical protein